MENEALTTLGKDPNDVLQNVEGEHTLEFSCILFNTDQCHSFGMPLCMCGSCLHALHDHDLAARMWGGGKKEPVVRSDDLETSSIIFNNNQVIVLNHSGIAKVPVVQVQVFNKATAFGGGF